MNKDMTPADVLRDTADLLEPEGAWCKGTFRQQHEDGSVALCALGALTEVVDRSGSGAKLFTSARTVLMDTIGNIMIPWNDAEDRTQQEVVDTMRLAAKRWEEENE